jgi:hypothetical protein
LAFLVVAFLLVAYLLVILLHFNHCGGKKTLTAK